MACGSPMCAEANQEQGISPGLPSWKHITYPSSVKGKKVITKGKASDTPHNYAVTSWLLGIVEKLTSLSSLPPVPSIHGPNQI